jgi:amino acid transporter
LAGSATPLADGGQRLLGTAGGLIMTVGAAVSILGTNSNTMLAGPRYLYALADAGALPRPLARIHPRFKTPYVAILIQAALSLPLALTGTFAELARLSVIARLATYLGTAAAVPILRRKLPPDERAVRLPGGPLIPILAFLVALALLAAAKRESLLAGGAALVIGALLYAVRPRLR